MRYSLLGLMVLSLVASAWGQGSPPVSGGSAQANVASGGGVEGVVESIGLGSYYRPDAWTPMVIRLRTVAGAARVYRIEVEQDDLDLDRAVYTRTVSLEAAAAEGSASRFWMYFLPRQSGGGLPDVMGGNATTKELREALRVYVATEDGRRILKLPIQNPAWDIDPGRRSPVPRPGSRLVLAVRDAGGAMSIGSLDPSNTLGTLEATYVANLRSDELPDNVLGYDSVDVVVWGNADPARLDADAGQRRTALEQWVRQGGRMVIAVGGDDWTRLGSFAGLLPVRAVGSRQRDSVPGDFQRMARTARTVNNPFTTLRGPIMTVLAEPLPLTRVERWIDWNVGGRVIHTPLLARHTVGLGSVTWVAMDLADPSLPLVTAPEWAFVWGDVLGWKDQPTPLTQNPQQNDRIREAWRESTGIDLGAALVNGVEHSARGAGLIGLAVFFFLLYWLWAGPISYLVFKRRGRAAWSWFIFAASAVAATLLTMGVVALVLRGSPTIRHITIVQAVPAPGGGYDAVVCSRVGVYSPRDGEHDIALHGAVRGSMSLLTPLTPHPQFAGADIRFPAPASYEVAVRPSDGHATLSPLIRSTLKKVQARWIGQWKAGIEGRPALGADGMISGTLTNGLPDDLVDVFIAVRLDRPLRNDRVFYLDRWASRGSINLASLEYPPTVAVEYRENRVPGRTTSPLRGGLAIPGDVDPMAQLNRAPIYGDWERLWYEQRRAGSFEEAALDDSANGYRQSFPMLSLFSVLSVQRSFRDGSPPVRSELLRRGARRLDLGHAVVSGDMLVIGRSANEELPLDLKVEDRRVESSGTTFYQFVLKVDRSAYEKPPAAATAPADPPPPARVNP